mmetsp:Transcript_59561/g.118040  ORF Transcript_59561/g.118040 Transcript_59561/m.118040 type:complete len:727 (-) Transcript_59561:206-2386(-)
MEPTRGAIGRIYSGNPSRDFNPYLEVRNIRKLDDPQGGTRYAVSVTDGDFVVKALALPGSSLISQIERNEVIVTTLLCLTDYRLEELNGSSFLLINHARVMGTVPEHLRVPSERLQKWVTAGARQQQPVATQPDPSAALFPRPATAAGVGGSVLANGETTPEKRGNFGAAEHTPGPVTMQPYPPMQGGAGAAAMPNPYSGPSCDQSMPAFQQQQQQQQQHQQPPPTAQGRAGASGNITDFFGRQPLVKSTTGDSSVGGFVPIKELSPYTSGRWRIKARVLTKSDIRRFSNARGEGQLFKIDIGDKSGEISGTFFGKAVDKYYPMLQQGQVYVFSRAHVKPANPRYDRGDVVLTFEDQSQVEAAQDDQEIPGVSFDFKPLCSVPELEQHTTIDVQAVIYAVQEPFHFTSKASNREMVKREIGIWDASGPDGGSACNVTVWGDRALSDGFEIGTPVFMKAARVSEWNGNKELSSPSVIEMNPDDGRAFTLKAKYEEVQKTRPLNMRTSTAGGASGARKTAQEVREEDMQLGPPPVMGQALDPNGPKAIHRHILQATISTLPTDRMPCYASCPALVARAAGATQQSGQAATERACQKKVTQEGPNMWRCPNGHVCQNPTFRYLCRMQVMDHTECLEVNVFDTVAKQFFGVEADTYTRIFEDPSLESQLQQIHKRVLWRRQLFRLRAQKEVWQEVERVKYHVDDVSSIAFAKDGRQMLSEVKAALATGQR